MKSRIWPTAVILLPAVIILSLSVLVLQLQRRASAADAATRASLAVDYRLRETLAVLTDIETGQRGFIIAGADAFLEPYYAGLQRWRTLEGELAAAESAMRPGTLLPLRELIIQKLAYGARMIELRRTAGRQAAEGVLASGQEGRRLMESIRRIVAAEQENQRSAIAKRRLAAERQKRILTITLLVGSVVALIAAVLGAVILLRHVRALEENSQELRIANDALQDQAASLEEHAEALQLRSSELASMAETLQRRETRFRTLIENSTDIIAVRADDGTLTFASPSMESVLGWGAEEAVGSKCLDAVHPDDAAIARGAFVRLDVAGAVVQFELRVAHRDQSWRTLQVQARRVDDETVRGVVINARDVTERRQLEEQLRQSQKMDAIGRLAGGISHDFNNLLTAIQGSVHFALQDLREDHPARADVAGIGAAAERASALTRQLLSFSRNRPTRYEPVDVAALLQDIERMLGRLLGEDIVLTTATPPDLWPVLADPGQLDQVLINLAVNARDAMPSGGTLRITARNELIDEAYSDAHVDVQPGEYVVLTVSDSGAGMDAATRARIFEPFFTTKPAGSGTGLGLSTVYGIVKQMRGHVWVYSEVGVGTTFKVHLPRAIGVVAEPPPPVAEPVHGQTCTVLLAEDDPAVRGLARRALERAGYSVLEAERPELALSLLERNAGGIDVLLTDMIMPSMNGVELAERVRRIVPGLPTIFMSGYTEDVVITRGMLNETDAFLEKPFSPDSLVRCVSRVVAGRDGGGSRVMQAKA